MTDTSLLESSDDVDQLDGDDPVIVVHRRRREDAQMDITPMIDITFLLLIFFLVAARIDEAATVPLPPAHSGLAVASKSAVILLVKRDGADGATVHRGDGSAFDGDLAEQEQQIIDYVAAGLVGQDPFPDVKQFVLIKAERDVKHRFVSDVARAVARASEGQHLYIAVLEEAVR